MPPEAGGNRKGQAVEVRARWTSCPFRRHLPPSAGCPILIVPKGQATSTLAQDRSADVEPVPCQYDPCPAANRPSDTRKLSSAGFPFPSSGDWDWSLIDGRICRPSGEQAGKPALRLASLRKHRHLWVAPSCDPAPRQINPQPSSIDAQPPSLASESSSSALDSLSFGSEPSSFDYELSSFWSELSSFCLESASFECEPASFRSEPSSFGSVPSSFDSEMSSFRSESSSFTSEASSFRPEALSFRSESASSDPESSSFRPEVPSFRAESSSTDCGASSFGAEASSFNIEASSPDSEPFSSFRVIHCRDVIRRERTESEIPNPRARCPCHPIPPAGTPVPRQAPNPWVTGPKPTGETPVPRQYPAAKDPGQDARATTSTRAHRPAAGRGRLEACATFDPALQRITRVRISSASLPSAGA